MNKLESQSPKDLSAKLVEISPMVLKRILIFIYVFSLFCNYLPLEKDLALHLYKLELISPKYALCQVWLKLVLWFWKRKFLNFLNIVFLFHNYLPLEKGVALHFNKLESLSSKDLLCLICLKLAILVLEKKMNSYRQTDD